MQYMFNKNCEKKEIQTYRTEEVKIHMTIRNTELTLSTMNAKVAVYFPILN